MTTQNGLNLVLSGSTGTGNFVGANTPTLITPNLGVATATSISYSPSTNGTVGTTTNNNAASGVVGEYFSSVIPFASAVNLALTATAYDMTSLSLTAGDWFVWGNVSFTIGGNSTGYTAWISTTSAMLPDFSVYNQIGVSGTTVTSGGISAPSLRLSLSSPTTVYISCESHFTTSTVTACGGLYAWRRR